MLLVEIEKPRIECVEKDEKDTYGKFVVEPLERGYGTTLGNSLRRVLLSSLPGAAVTSVRIEGVLHEFSTIPGVREDTTDIILNLKGLALRMYGEGPVTIRIEAQGEGVVTAGDIITGPDIEVVNPELYIATLEPDGRLFMEMTVEKGRGYVPAERNKKAEHEHRCQGLYGGLLPGNLLRKAGTGPADGRNGERVLSRGDHEPACRREK